MERAVTRAYNNKSNHGSDLESDDNGYQYSKPRKQFRRNKIDGVIGGVCAGIGDYTGLDPVIVRILTVLSFFLLLGPIVIFVYIGLWIFTPSDNRAPYRREHLRARRAKRRHEEDPSEPVRSAASYRTVRGKFSSLEERLQDLEKSITSSEWQLRRDFRDLEN